MKKIIIATVAVALGLQAGLIGVMLGGVDVNVALTIAVCVCGCLIATLIVALVSGLILPGKVTEEELIIPTEPIAPAEYDEEVVEPIEPSKGDVENPPVKIKDEEVSYFENYLSYISDKLGRDASDRVRDDIEAIIGEKSNGRIDEVFSSFVANSNSRVKGLVVGRVQSGKTMNYTGLITRAIDEGWNVIVVLTSNNISLKSQTVARLRKDLSLSGLTADKYTVLEDFLSNNLPSMADIKKGKIYIGFALKQADHLRGRRDNGKGVVGWFDGNREDLKSARIVVVDDEADNATQNTLAGAQDWSDEAVRRYANNIRSQAKTSHEQGQLAVAKWIDSLIDSDVDIEVDGENVNKLKSILDQRIDVKTVEEIIEAYKDLLKLNLKVKIPGIHGTPLLYGLVCNYFTSIGDCKGHSRADDFKAILRWFLDVKRERSEINKAITSLVSPEKFECEKMAYVGYTATPYANFFNECPDADNPLKLDFAQSMSVAPEYFGLAKIFGKDKSQGGARMPIVKVIPENERKGITSPFMCGRDIQLDESLQCTYVDGDQTIQSSWDSLKTAINWAIVSAAIRRGIRISKGISESGDETLPSRWSTMLVNLSRSVDDHNNLADYIRKYIAHQGKDLSSFKKECIKCFQANSQDINKQKFEELFSDYPHEVENPSIEAVEKHLDYVLGNIRVIALNSDGENAEVYNEYVQNVTADKKLYGDYLWIVVGGNRISRGLTFEGLVSSYFDRDGISVKVDTLTQMGRWFGYRVGYELLPRVWMPEGAINTMKEICELEEELHSQLTDEFARKERNPNPILPSITRRLTSRDNAMVIDEEVANPVITREFRSTIVNGDSKQKVVKFLKACGKPKDHSEGSDKVFARLSVWEGVAEDVYKEFWKDIRSLFSEKDISSVSIAFNQLLGAVDIVLANPKNSSALVSLDEIGSVHSSVISKGVEDFGGYVRLSKFSGQYESWKAVFSNDIVCQVERDLGTSRANTSEALNKMVELKKKLGQEVRPIIQIGFVKWLDEDEALPYVSVYCPGIDVLRGKTAHAGNIVDMLPQERRAVRISVGGGDTVQPVKVNNITNSVQRGTSSELRVETSSSSSEVSSDSATKDLSSTPISELTDKQFWDLMDEKLRRNDGEVAERRQREQEEFNRVAQEATAKLRKYVNDHNDELMRGMPFTRLWRVALGNTYNNVLGLYGNRIFPTRDVHIENFRRGLERYNLPLEAYLGPQNQFRVRPI